MFEKDRNVRKRFEWYAKPLKADGRKRAIEFGLGSPASSGSSGVSRATSNTGDINNIATPGLSIDAGTGEAQAGTGEDSDDDAVDAPLSCILREEKNMIIVESNSSNVSTPSRTPSTLRFDRDSFSIVLTNPTNSYMFDHLPSRRVVVELHPMFLWRLVLNERRRNLAFADRDYIRLRTMCSRLISGSVATGTSATGTSATGSRHSIKFVFSENRCECYQSNGQKLESIGAIGAIGEDDTFSDDIVLSCLRRIISNLRRKTDPFEQLTVLFDLCISHLYNLLPIYKNS